MPSFEDGGPPHQGEEGGPGLRPRINQNSQYGSGVKPKEQEGKFPLGPF